MCECVCVCDAEQARRSVGCARYLSGGDTVEHLALLLVKVWNKNHIALRAAVTVSSRSVAGKVLSLTGSVHY